MNRFILLLISVLLFIAACREEPKKFACGTSNQKATGVTVNHYQPKNGIDGKALFKANCAACHFASQKKSTGPGLQGVLSRIPAGNWKYDYIRDSKKMIDSGDAYANVLYKEYNQMLMPLFVHLSNEEIDEILRYCDEGQ